MRRSSLGVRCWLVLAILLGLLVTVPLTANAAEGDVWAWGHNKYGKLGDGTTTDATSPIQFPTQLENVVQVAGGFGHSLALLDDGTVWSWGWNGEGQLGDGTYESSTVPVQVIGPLGGDDFLTDIAKIQSGSNYALALTEDGTAYTWGTNDSRELGNGGSEDSNRPVLVSLPVGVTVVDIASGAHHGLALTDDGTVYGWGSNARGQLGIGSISVSVSTPVEVTALTGLTSRIVKIASGSGATHSFAIAEDGTLYEWGDDYFNSDLGDQDHRLTPVIVTGISDVVDAAAGNRHSLARTTSGDVYGWGLTYYNGTGSSDEVVMTPEPVMSGVTTIVAGRHFSLALTNDGTLYSWGGNSNGQLGIGSQDSQLTPVLVTTSVTFSAIGAGWYHALAVEGLPALPPTTTATINGQPPTDDWYQSATVTLTPDDATATTTYEINGGTTQTYSAPFDLTPDGVYTITFRSVDPANNVEADQTLTVNVDSTPPVFQPIANQTLNPTSTAGAPVTFTVQVSDNLSSAGTITATCLDQNNAPFVSGDTAPVGLTTITCTASDLAGNSASVSFTVTVRGVDGAFDVLQAQIAGLEIPRIMKVSLQAQARMAERMADADRAPLSCLQLRVLDLTVQLLGWVRVVNTQDAAEIHNQILLIREFLDC